jgi:hypothetical protein
MYTHPLCTPKRNNVRRPGWPSGKWFKKSVASLWSTLLGHSLSKMGIGNLSSKSRYTATVGSVKKKARTLFLVKGRNTFKFGLSVSYFIRIFAASNHLLYRLIFSEQWNVVSLLKTSLPVKISPSSSPERESQQIVKRTVFWAVTCLQKLVPVTFKFQTFPQNFVRCCSTVGQCAWLSWVGCELEPHELRPPEIRWLVIFGGLSLSQTQPDSLNNLYCL